jgi:putative transposase
VAQARDKGIELVGPDGLLSQLTKRVLETALEAEMSDHLGYDKHDPVGRNRGNSRNGVRSKTVLTEIGPVEIEVPRDIDATFSPTIVKKRQRRLTGVDQIVLSLSARGLTTGEISAHFAEVYGASVSRETVSKITDQVLEEMTAWMCRPLDEGRVLANVANHLWCSLSDPSLQGLLWCAVTQAEARSVVELGGDAVELAGGPGVEVGPLRKVLP